MQVADKNASKDSFESEGDEDEDGEVLSPEAIDESFHAVDDDEEDVRDLDMVSTSNSPALKPRSHFRTDPHVDPNLNIRSPRMIHI